MDLVSNITGFISPIKIGEWTRSITQNVDIEDKTFSDILEKQMNKQEEKSNYAENLGIPSGMNIFDLIGYENAQNTQSETLTNTIQPVNKFDNPDLTDKDFSSEEILTFFSSLFDSKPTLTDSRNNGIFDFERKTAAGQYNKYARNVVTDISEFVSDALKIS